MVVGAVGSAVVLAAGWQLGVVLDTGTTTQSATSAPSGSASSSASSSSSPSASGGGASVSGSFTGTSERTRYGNVQVKLVVASGKITDVVAVHLTDQGGRSVQLSNKAAPILRAEVLKSQSAKVANVSGATYTSDAYLLSVQSAIDASGL
jgi:uncharacterized protein with FMN-binding domain